jgi:hypothetical protein
MNRMNKVIFPLILTAASSFALAEGGSERTLHRLNDPETKSTLKELVKEGKVLNIAPGYGCADGRRNQLLLFLPAAFRAQGCASAE